MGLFNWFSLPKTQDDPETIEQAIERYLLFHNNDNEAHLGEGQSLQSHKASEIIDHRLYSVHFDNLERALFNKSVITTSFQSLDGFEVVSPEYQFSLAGFWINTSNVLDNRAYILTRFVEGFSVNWSKNPIFNASLKFSYVGNHDIYFGIGDRNFSESGPFCGFEIHNGVLSASVWDFDGANKNTEEIYDITLNEFNNYHFEFEHGVGVKFYINDILVANLAYNISNITSGYYFFLEMFNRTAGQHVEAFIKPFSYSEAN